MTFGLWMILDTKAMRNENMTATNEGYNMSQIQAKIH